MSSINSSEFHESRFTMRQFKRVTAVLSRLLMALSSRGFAADAPTAEQVEFFETRIRPVLVEQCYSCHNSAKTAEGSLTLDDRAGLLKGGDGGAIVVPKKPGESRLLAILRHQVPGMKMPQGGAKLDERVIADFEKWIAMGVPDPRDKPPTAEEIAKATSWEAVLEKRKKWWSLQPVRRIAPPDVAGSGEWSSHPVDQFVFAKLREKGLEPSPSADARTLVRRAFFAVIGLPPTPEEVEHWTARVGQPKGFEELVDHLLDSPHFGERWARHWMDWIRYADSHGSEGDPTIENGWLFRDYLIRALNADVSYDQLVREHIAGDLLDRPRINEKLGINESVIGPAHWRMVFHGFAPTDALDEKVRFIDDQIGTFSKAFLGLTVACARCHDHKFDAISQKDYYALFGILGSCRPGRTAIDAPEKLDTNRDKLTALKPQIRTAIADAWLGSATKLREQLLSDDELWTKADKSMFILHPWSLLRKDVKDSVSFVDAWPRRMAAWSNEFKQREALAQRSTLRHWHLNRAADVATWTRTGSGLADAKPAPAGEFAIAANGNAVLTGIYPSGVYSHRLSAKHAARLTSGDVPLDDNYDLWLRVIGEGGASTRFVVQDYPRNGTVFPIGTLQKEWHWQKFDMTYWNGDDMHVEITAGRDAPLMANNEPRSWFGVREVLIVKKGEAAPPEPHEFLDPWFESAAKAPPKSLDEAADQFVAAVTAAIKAWLAGTASDAQASLLDACLKQGLLPNEPDRASGRLNSEPWASALRLITEYRRLEEEIVVPTRVPGLEETTARQQALFVRGNHKQPGDIVPRRFLEAIDSTPYPNQTTSSGRLQLADDVLRASNPLTRRVIVNRLWHHLFGRGIVATPDNFGRLGHAPTHPELLDHLAARFLEDGGSVKQMIRLLVTSKTWQLTSRPSEKAQQVDPDNLLLSHAQVRRLEAEAIRDALLTVSGSLSRDLFGAPVDGNSARRSVYVRVQRNALDPFLRAFDFPEPFSTVGRRDVTNVPAQSLTLMNDDRVASLASNWAARVLAEKSDEDRIRSMFVAAFGRPAQATEVSKIQTYLAETKTVSSETANQVAELRRQIDERQTAVRKLVDPVRTRLLAEAKAKSATGEQVVPKPIGRWEFEDDLKDVVGNAHGESRNGARIEGGALVVNQQAHVVTAPLKQTLKEKTLEAWVQLDNLDQHGGGVMTIQSRDGAVFDSIVFAEQAPRQWLAGSNNFARTQPFNGPADADAASRAVHVAIAYHADGQIVGYRDGQPYGKSYKSNGPHEFKAGESVVSFGVRHLPVGGNKMLSGRILRAQLYDRALTAEEVSATSQSAPYFVSESQILAALTEADRQQLDVDKQRIAALEAQIAAFGPISESVNDKALWTDLARAMFTFQEFLFVK